MSEQINDGPCGECKFFLAEAAEVSGGASEWGHCRRYPPTPVYNPRLWTDRVAGSGGDVVDDEGMTRGCVTSEYPEVSAREDWCGEWSPAESRG